MNTVNMKDYFGKLLGCCHSLGAGGNSSYYICNKTTDKKKLLSYKNIEKRVFQKAKRLNKCFLN